MPDRNNTKWDRFVPLGLLWRQSSWCFYCQRFFWFFTETTSCGRLGVQETRHVSILLMYSCYSPIKAYKYPNDSNKYTKNFTDCNVTIYIEQAIARMKTFRIIKHELPISLLPVVDDIVLLRAIMKNFMEPLCSDDN